MKKILIVFSVIIIITISFYLFYREGTLPVNKNDKSTKIFVIRRGENLTMIINNLAKENLIRNKMVFYLVVKKLKIEKKIQAGDFRLSPSMTAYQIAKALTHGTLDIWITLIEGTRKEEMAQVIAQSLDIPESEFIKSAEEGYLFPDTYLIPKEATAGSVVEILTKNFHRRFNDKLKQKAKKKGLTEKEVIILASLVEREARIDDDRKIVASILLKRYRQNWPLQVDASIQYALGYQPTEKSWWKKNLTVEDLKLDSPYNSYKNTGLPPTPIANPGLASIIAVIDANEDTPYWYYLSDRKGKIHYATTLEEHQKNIKKYLQ